MVNGLSGTIGAFATNDKNQKFTMSFFKDSFPVNKAVNIDWSSALAYEDESGNTYVCKSGTMKITSYGATSSGAVNNIKGIFNMIAVSNGKELNISEGVFDLSTK